MKPKSTQVINIRIEDLASSLRMSEMPDPDLLEEKTAALCVRYHGMPEERLQKLILWEREREFANHEKKVTEELHKRIKTYDIDSYIRDGVFSFYPRTSWKDTSAKILGNNRVRDRHNWKDFVEDTLKCGLSQLPPNDAIVGVEVLHPKGEEEHRPHKISGDCAGPKK